MGVKTIKILTFNECNNPFKTGKIENSIFEILVIPQPEKSTTRKPQVQMNLNIITKLTKYF